MTPYQRCVRDIRISYLGREIAAVSPAMPIVESPFISPCSKGHDLTAAGGMIRCRRCGVVIGKAPPPKPPKPKRGGGIW
jgi:hypothetical protein